MLLILSFIAPSHVVRRPTHDASTAATTWHGLWRLTYVAATTPSTWCLYLFFFNLSESKVSFYFLLCFLQDLCLHRLLPIDNRGAASLRNHYKALPHLLAGGTPGTSSEHRTRRTRQFWCNDEVSWNRNFPKFCKCQKWLTFSLRD
jgi:hypothetical protein